VSQDSARTSVYSSADVQNQPILGLKVNKLSSQKAQLPYEYYSLPYCKPDKIVSSPENLGEVLRGDRIANSLYEVCQEVPSRAGFSATSRMPDERLSMQLSMRTHEQCKILCRHPPLTEIEAKKFTARIKEEYRVNLCATSLRAQSGIGAVPRSEPAHTVQDSGQPPGCDGVLEERRPRFS
jgi:transmembrane 9 superfamily member 2/4